MIYYNERWLTIYWEESTQAVWMEWKSYVEGEEFRSALDAGISVIRQKRASRWLADLRRLGPIRQVDQQWTNEDWFPRAVAAGVRAMALVSPTAAVSRMSVQQIMSRVKEIELVTAYFDDLEEARTWLRGFTAKPSR